MTTSTAQGNIPVLTIGWRLQMTLDHAGVSVQDMAEALGVSRSTISRWFHEPGVPIRNAYLVQWSLVTGVPIEWIKTGELPDPTDPDGGERVTPLNSRSGRKEPATRRTNVLGVHPRELLPLAA